MIYLFNMVILHYAKLNPGSNLIQFTQVIYLSTDDSPMNCPMFSMLNFSVDGHSSTKHCLGLNHQQFIRSPFSPLGQAAKISEATSGPREGDEETSRIYCKSLQPIGGISLTNDHKCGVQIAL